MVIVYSATKGLAAMTLALAHSRGWLDYEERVCAVLAGVRAARQRDESPFGSSSPIRPACSPSTSPSIASVVADLDRPGGRARPAEARVGTGNAAGVSRASRLGFYEGELLRRVDPQHRSLGQFFQDEIASPLGLDVYIRLPADIPNSRLATIAPPRPIDMLRRLSAPL